jgi:DNA repair photolyase
MAYYLEEQTTTAFGDRRPTINEYFLSTYTASVYDGCEFGCPYCDGWAFRSRPLNETIRVGVNLPAVAAQELATIDRGDLIAITSQSDPYQPAEATYRLTRQLLQLFADHGQPCLVLTKSHTVLEDLALLQKINEKSLAIVMFTIVSTDQYIAGKLEEKSPPPQVRLDAIAELKRNGVPVGVAYLPIMPYVNDTDYVINTTIRSISDAGADFVIWDYLHISGERHRARIEEMLARLGNYPPNYYRELYAEHALPNSAYRAERDRILLERCDALNLPARAPHHLYAGKLRRENEAALLLKQVAFRDAVIGRSHIARTGRDLAELVFRGQATNEQLRPSPIYLAVRQILAGEKYIR